MERFSSYNRVDFSDDSHLHRIITAFLLIAKSIIAGVSRSWPAIMHETKRKGTSYCRSVHALKFSREGSYNVQPFDSAFGRSAFRCCCLVKGASIILRKFQFKLGRKSCLKRLQHHVIHSFHIPLSLKARFCKSSLPSQIYRPYHPTKSLKTYLLKASMPLPRFFLSSLSKTD